MSIVYTVAAKAYAHIDSIKQYRDNVLSCSRSLWFTSPQLIMLISNIVAHVHLVLPPHRLVNPHIIYIHVNEIPV